MLPRYWRAKSKRGKDAGSLDSQSYRGDRGRRIAPHPTLSEAIKEAGLVALGRAIHIPNRKPRAAAPA